MLYWPNAIVQDKYMERSVYKIMTYDGYASYEEAKSMIGDWKKGGYGFEILSSWIEVFEGKKMIGCIDHECETETIIWG